MRYEGYRLEVSDSYLELKALVPAQHTRGISPPGAGLLFGTLRPGHAVEACERFGLLGVSPDGQTDLHLLTASRDHDDQKALVCLRCRVSHPAVRALHGFDRRYGASYGLDLLEMAVLVLDDHGDLHPYANPRAQLRGGPAPNRHEPFFLVEVIRTFKSGFCGLPHWTRLRIQACKELKAYLKQHGLLLISDWALLADSSTKRVREAWDLFGQGGLPADHVVALHRAYQALYRQAKNVFHDSYGRSTGWLPDTSFLQQLSKEVAGPVVATDLSSIAQAIRCFLVGPRGAFQPFDESTEYSAAIAYDLLDELEAEHTSAVGQRNLINAALQRAMAGYLPGVLGPSAANPCLLRCLWQGYGEGLSNRPNAERCGCTAGTVSKKLTPELHAHCIALSATQELQRHQLFASIGQSVEATERCVSALKNHLLNPEGEGEEAPMRFWIRTYLSRP